tara:strand:- start:71500 stop:71862 length:363 start_codon:yes stop_codon:yes gene_type:complete
MKKYENMTMTELWITLSFLEQTLAVLSRTQEKIAYHVQQNILTDSEVAPLVEKSTKAFADIDEATIEIEKAMDKKIRDRTGIRHLSGSCVRITKELDSLIAERQKKAQKEADKKPELKLS